MRTGETGTGTARWMWRKKQNRKLRAGRSPRHPNRTHGRQQSTGGPRSSARATLAVQMGKVSLGEVAEATGVDGSRGVARMLVSFLPFLILKLPETRLCEQ